jgi:membrane protein YdbS with pleckstrin-like domain
MKMDARNILRLAISVFLLVLITIATTGWIWTGRHQPGSQALASRVVLTICIVAGVVGLHALWRTRAPR